MVFSPVFDKIRQYQTITMDITVSYGNVIIVPQIVQADSPSSILELSLNGNKLNIKCNNISAEKQLINIHVSNDNPMFDISKTIEIQCVSMLG